MSTQSFLTRDTDGDVVLELAITESSGVPSANQILATATDGKIDPSFLPPGLEIQVETAVATEDLLAGDFVNIYDNMGTNGVRKAIANDVDRLANGFILDNFLASETASIYTKGINTSVAATKGKKSFLSVDIAGNSTEIAPPAVSGHFQQVLGIGVPSGLVFEFFDPIYFA